MLDRLKARAHEPSTWAGLAVLASILGVDGAEQFTAPDIAGALAAVAAILMKEANNAR